MYHVFTIKIKKSGTWHKRREKDRDGAATGMMEMHQGWGILDVLGQAINHCVKP